MDVLASVGVFNTVLSVNNSSIAQHKWKVVSYIFFGRVRFIFLVAGRDTIERFRGLSKLTSGILRGGRVGALSDAIHTINTDKKCLLRCEYSQL